MTENVKIYHELTQKMRNFFLEKGYLEVPSQSKLSILAACENPHSIVKYQSSVSNISCLVIIIYRVYLDYTNIGKYRRAMLNGNLLHF